MEWKMVSKLKDRLETESNAPNKLVERTKRTSALKQAQERRQLRKYNQDLSTQFELYKQSSARFSQTKGIPDESEIEHREQLLLAQLGLYSEKTGADVSETTAQIQEAQRQRKQYVQYKQDQLQTFKAETKGLGVGRDIETLKNNPNYVKEYYASGELKRIYEKPKSYVAKVRGKDRTTQKGVHYEIFLDKKGNIIEENVYEPTKVSSVYDKKYKHDQADYELRKVAQATYTDKNIDLVTDYDTYQTSSEHSRRVFKGWYQQFTKKVLDFDDMDLVGKDIYNIHKVSSRKVIDLKKKGTKLAEHKRRPFLDFRYDYKKGILTDFTNPLRTTTITKKNVKPVFKSSITFINPGKGFVQQPGKRPAYSIKTGKAIKL